MPFGFGSVKRGRGEGAIDAVAALHGARHHIRVVPVKVRRYSVPLDVLTRGVVGYRRECSCGARGPVRRTVALARVAPFDHDDGGSVGTGKVDSTHAASPQHASPTARPVD